MSEDIKHNKEYDASVSEDDEEIEEESNQSHSEKQKKEELIKKKFVHRLQIIYNQGNLIDYPTFAKIKFFTQKFQCRFVNIGII